LKEGERKRSRGKIVVGKRKKLLLLPSGWGFTTEFGNHLSLIWLLLCWWAQNLFSSDRD
jgi:hypothetical protein